MVSLSGLSRILCGVTTIACEQKRATGGAEMLTERTLSLSVFAEHFSIHTENVVVCESSSLQIFSLFGNAALATPTLPPVC